MQNAMIDFNLFKVRTNGERILNDKKMVLLQYSKKLPFTLLGIIDTTVNMGKLGRLLTSDGLEYAY